MTAPTRRHRGALLLVLAVVLATLVGTGNTTARAGVIIGASVSGRVVADDDGRPLAGVFVQLHRVVDGVPEDGIGRFDRTDADGRYQMDRIPPGTYTLDFVGVEDRGGEWWADQPDAARATAFRLEPGQRAVGVDVGLGRAGRLAGTVLTNDGAPLPGASVSVVTNRGGHYNATTTADSRGRWSVAVPVAGTYKIIMGGGDDHPRRWYGGDGSYASSTDVATTAGTTVDGLDQVLQRGGSIQGTATVADTGEPLRGARVSVGTDRDFRHTTTDASGHWRLDGLYAGTRTVVIRETPTTLAAAVEGIEVTPGGLATVSLTPPRAGHITGTVTGDDGRPIFGAEVSLGTFSGWHTTDAQGRYSIGNLRPGAYQVVFDHGADYPRQWWGGAITQSDAPTVRVGPGETRTGIDATLARGATVSGRVTSPDGDPVVTASVVLVHEDGQGRLVGLPGDVTDAAGRYRILGAPTGSFRLLVRPGATPFAQTTWGGSPWAADADRLPVTAGEDLDGIDVVVARGASIRGVVVGSDGEPATDRTVRVQLLDRPRELSREYETVQTDASGAWSTDGLRSGRYRVDTTCDGVEPTSPEVEVEVEVGDAQVRSLRLALPPGAAVDCTPVITVAGPPRVTGRARVGSVLRVRTGRVLTPQTDVTYTWWAGRRRVASPFGNALVLRPGMRGARIAVRATVTRPGLRTVHLRSAPTARVR